LIPARVRQAFETAGFTARYIWPELRFRPRVEALRPLLILHSFVVGADFLIDGGATAISAVGA
jgi:hypothetical protein